MNLNIFSNAMKILVGVLVAISLCITSSCSPSVENSPDEAEITATPTILITPVAGQLVVVADIVNLRTGPGVTFELHGTLTKGDVAEFDGVLATGSWYRLTDGSWVAESFVDLVNGEISEATLVPLESPSPIPLGSTSPLPLESPSATVTTTAIKPTKILATQTPKSTSMLTNSPITCQTTGDVFLLSGPGNINTYHIVKALDKGSQVTILGGNHQNGNHTHYKVHSAEGHQGWLPSEWCPVIGDPAINYTSFPPTFTPTATPTSTPSVTPSPSPTPTSTLLSPITLTPSPTNVPRTPTPIPPEIPTPQATGTQPSPNAFR